MTTTVNGSRWKWTLAWRDAGFEPCGRQRYISPGWSDNGVVAYGDPGSWNVVARVTDEDGWQHEIRRRGFTEAEALEQAGALVWLLAVERQSPGNGLADAASSWEKRCWTAWRELSELKRRVAEVVA